MGDWIQKLKQTETERESSRRQEQEWKLRCDRFVRSRAPEFFGELRGALTMITERLNVAFPDDSSKHIEFDGPAGDYHFTVINRVAKRNMTVVYFSDRQVIRLDMRTRRDILSAPQELREELGFHVADRDDVRVAFGGLGSVEAIADHLPKWLLGEK